MPSDISALPLCPRPQEACGVFGIMEEEEAAAITALGLHALQHRGQQSAGIVSCRERVFHAYRGMGRVDQHFSKSSVIAELPGSAAIGHVRYATSGDVTSDNIQPLDGTFEFGEFALAHNGNLTNADELRLELIAAGYSFQSTVDTEVILRLMETFPPHQSAVELLIQALTRVEGAFSLIALTSDQLIGVRDPLGIRPLVLGRHKVAHHKVAHQDVGQHEVECHGVGRHKEAWVLASETCALDIIGAEFVRDIAPGEVIAIGREGQCHSQQPFERRSQRFCIFEYIYFARPDSVAEGHSVYGIRQRLGQELARESGVESDMVVPVPDSGVPAALGYAAESGLAFELGIIRNHYVGRTFIEPSQAIRNLGVKLKHNANRALLKGKRVVLVDDSIVRGTTSRKIIELVRAAGAKEVHLRISSPPTRHPCFFGIATPVQQELLGHNLSVKDMRSHVGADSLAFLSLEGLYRAVEAQSRQSQPLQQHLEMQQRSEMQQPEQRYCDACFTGNYPTKEG